MSKFAVSAKNWARTHTTYTMHDFSMRSNDADVMSMAHGWRQRQEQATNGHLIKNNSFFRSHEEDGPTYFVHGTGSLNHILDSGSIHVSAGCLVGSLYTSQAYREANGDFRLHNLGSYILNREVPMILSEGAENRQRSLLLFEVENLKDSNPMLAGIDYLRMGDIHFNLYMDLANLLSKEERYDLEKAIVQMIARTTKILAQANHLFMTNANLTTEQAKAFLQDIHDSPEELILAYLYFEALSEYLMLHSQDAETKRLADKGEFNNWLYKDMMYTIRKDFYGKFHLSEFTPSPAMLKKYVDDATKTGKLDIDFDNMLVYVAERIVYWINTRLFNTPGVYVRWLDSGMDFDDICEVASPLIGHLIHRKLRQFKRYRDFYFYFDNLKALQAWNYWNKADIMVPFNGVFPKGEVGINPAHPDLKYKVFTAEKVPGTKDRIRKLEEVELHIAPRLVDPRMSFMRAGGQYAIKKKLKNC